MDPIETAARKAWNRPWPFDRNSEWFETFEEGWNACSDAGYTMCKECGREEYESGKAEVEMDRRSERLKDSDAAFDFHKSLNAWANGPTRKAGG